MICANSTAVPRDTLDVLFRTQCTRVPISSTRWYSTTPGLVESDGESLEQGLSESVARAGKREPGGLVSFREEGICFGGGACEMGQREVLDRTETSSLVPSAAPLPRPRAAVAPPRWPRQPPTAHEGAARQRTAHPSPAMSTRDRRDRFWRRRAPYRRRPCPRPPRACPAWCRPRLQAARRGAVCASASAAATRRMNSTVSNGACSHLAHRERGVNTHV